MTALVTELPIKMTRQTILQAAYSEFYLNGYQGGSINNVIKKAGTTKGALFHHFTGKKALGLAVLDEVIRPMIWQDWLAPLEKSDDPATAILTSIEMEPAEAEAQLKCGCPLANIAQEMSPLDEDFRMKVDGFYIEWRRVMADSFTRGIKAGKIRPEVNSETTAAFVVAAFTGVIANAKNTRDFSVVERIVHGLRTYLLSLKT